MDDDDEVTDWTEFEAWVRRGRTLFLETQWILLIALAKIPSKFIKRLNYTTNLLISMRLKMWLRRARTMIRTRLEYRPGGEGYLRAREDFMIRAGQRRATRRYRPY